MDDEDSWGEPRLNSDKDASPAQPEALVPGADSGVQSESSDNDSEQEGVQTGGLSYVPNLDGTRNYRGQELVETEDDPTPTPAEDPNAPVDPVAEKTSEPVGR